MQDITGAMTELAEATLELALAQALADQAERYGVPRNGRRTAHRLLGRRHGQARRARAERVVRHRPRLRLRGRRRDRRRRRSVSAHEYLRPGRAQPLHADRRDDRGRLRVPRRPGAAAERQFGPAGGQPGDARGVPAGAGPRVGALRLAEEPRRRAARERAERPRAARCARVVTAFVYRRYLDYGVFEGLRQLHRKVRDEAQRRAAGRPERANDVKLSRGGIREIEFIVQLLLVVRGGQFPEIRTRSTLKALDKLAAGGLMKPESAAAAGRGLHASCAASSTASSTSTTSRPTCCRAATATWTGSRAASASTAADDACELLDRLGEIREFVAHRVRCAAARRSRAAPAQTATAAARPAARRRRRSTARTSSSSCRRSWPHACSRCCDNPKIKVLRDESKAAPRRASCQRAARAAQRRASCTMEAATRFIDWLEPLLRRESYLALLVERPEVQDRLLRLLGLARWPMRYLMRHPGVIDELADERLLHGRFDATGFCADLEERHDAWERSGQADEESLLDTLRRAHHAEVFRTLVRDVERPHQRRAGRRRPLGAGRRDARLRDPLGLAAPEAGAPRRAAPGGDRLRQARRQGARLRQRPRPRVRLRRRRRARVARSTAPSCAS